MNPILHKLVAAQCGLCHYCKCKMETGHTQPTVEHLVDKWSSPGHIKIEDRSNLVAACHRCNNSRGNARNMIARSYYKSCAVKKGIKMAVQSTSSKTLFKMFGPVPQELFA